ncbi:cytochrome-c peroxidase [Chitinophaga agri]|uniref:Methylamine utilization protein MauG n=1 Tax=Chitinophaga agri TaxID=2703787 RepID=A0A6B9ZD61_9BACT|nr:cytochrome c peroxidase [Chitinophaga agri]QHS59075.1 cytochrome-c peroxidase [Chitinophaga agri]
MRFSRIFLVAGLLSGAILLGAAGISMTAPQYTIEELRQLYSSGDPSKWPAPDLDSATRIGFRDIGKLDRPSYPDYNPYSKEKEVLGRTLFYDPRMSKSLQLSCASCHDPELGWGDGRRVSYGHNRQTGKRNAMTLFNVGFYKHFFWDGRATTLEQQAVFPVQDKVEMAQTLTQMEANIKAIPEYAVMFKDAFGDAAVTVGRIQYAIATFERSIVSNSSRFDKFVTGSSELLSDEEVKGLHLFRTRARCINCHNTPLFSDNQFHNDGQALYGSKMEDFGHYHLSGKQEDIGAFRTPSLREVGQTGPWMHHGNFPTLRDVVEYYNLGNPSPIQKFVQVDESKRPVPSPVLRKLNLDKEELHALEAFLKTLTTQVRKPAPPALPGMN